MTRLARGLVRSELPLPLLARGKVRDVYDAGADRLLIVTTDRVSAFDVVMADPVPGKGVVLNQITAWWLSQLPEARPHHMITADPAEILEQVPELTAESVPGWQHRAMLVRRTEPVPVECVVRGYLAGSVWSEYRERGTVAGETVPTGLRQGDPFEEPIFSPATKATTGHDENITVSELRGRIGVALTEHLRERSIALYLAGASRTAAAGMIMADTKFEFGRMPNGEIVLIDEVLTPDSSRFWPVDSYRTGISPPSFDKQFVRDYLETLDWDKKAPGPRLPPEIIERTAAKYREALTLLTAP
jgi:phosphoribosylaminoimidazole-succinocarboxamide synthase